jgi:acetyl-CoA carboxylase biotin carboxyl carrier protein
MAHREHEMLRLMGEVKTCMVREVEGHRGHFDVLSPGVGLFDLPPAVGTFLEPGSFVGYLTVLRRYFHLALPEKHHGVVTERFVTTRKHSVQYGEALFRVSPESASLADAVHEIGEAAPGAVSDDIPAGMFGVRSPTDGIFYRRANPQSPPYAEEGDVIEQGATLGLVEVMKCFNPIIYPGEPEFPHRARIVRIAAQDSAEVKHGTVLYIVEPKS